MIPVDSQLEEIVDDLIKNPPRDENSYLKKQSVLRRSYSPEQLAEIHLLCASKEAKFTSEHLLLELNLQDVEDEKRWALLEKLNQVEKNICSAAQAGHLACPSSDHSLRGQIRYLQNYIDSNTKQAY